MTHNWRKILVSPDSTIEETIEKIDSEALRLALVVDGSECLLGTVTDGDIRRALIQHKDLKSPIKDVMNSKPHVADASTPKGVLMSMMEKYDLLSIPLVESGRIVGLETLRHLLKKPKNEAPVFLMAGGFGTRLRPLTDNCPKPLLKVGDKPILETIIESFISAGFYRFFVSTHYMPEMIRSYFGDGSKWGVEINYVHEDSPLGTGGALGLLPRDLPDSPIIVMNGDVLTKVNFERLLAYHEEQGALATMCVREYEYQVPYGVVKADGHKITHMVEKPKHKYFVNAGIYVLDRAILMDVEENHRIDMPDLLGAYMVRGEMISMFPVHEYWLDIGRMADFERAQADVLSLGVHA